MKKLFFYHASWCPPCKYAEKHVIRPLIEIYGNDKIICINVERESLQMDTYKVNKVPTVIVVHGEEEVYRQVGAQDYDTLRRLLND